MPKKVILKKELYEIALAQRLELQKETPSYVGNFVLVKTDGSIEQHISEACYGSFSGLQKSIAYVADDPMLLRKKGPISLGRNPFKDYEKEYIGWWVNKSFAAKAFKTKDVEDILANGVVVDCRWPASYVITALIGLRYLSEFTDLVSRWHRFKQHINADAASFLMHKFELKEDGWHQSNFERNHTWLTYFAGREQFTRIIEHDFSQFDRLPAMTKNQNYQPLMQCFSSHSQRFYDGQRKYDYNSGLHKGPNELIFPEGIYKRVKTIFGKESEEKLVYKDSEMKTWLNKTVALNRILEGNKP